MKKLVDELIKKHDTRDPEIIASNLGIQVLYEELGKINGYFNIILDVPFIHINQSLSKEKQLFTLAHELGHAILHVESNTLFLMNYTHQSVAPMEIEANRFAAQLVFPDEFVEEYKHLSVYSLSEIYQVDDEIMKYRINYNRITDDL